jgi:UDP:flavonoid glycosyltransferase YjiC (YdhE family)
MWAAAVNQLEVGIGRPFCDAALNSLFADLRSILTPHCVSRTREVAVQMTTPAQSAATAADLLEDAVGLRPLADRRTRIAE